MKGKLNVEKFLKRARNVDLWVSIVQGIMKLEDEVFDLDKIEHFSQFDTGTKVYNFNGWAVYEDEIDEVTE